MKLVRVGPRGHEQPGIIDANGKVRSLAQHLPDLTPEHLSPESLARIAGVDPERLPELSQPLRFGVPVSGVRKFIAIGLNFADHAAEANIPLPAEPIIFTKAISCLNGANDDVVRPRGSTKLDWEVELGVVIGTTAKYVDERDALKHVAGYVVVNDISERRFQLERGGTWDKGKGCDTFGPVGPWLVTRDEIGDVQQLDMWLDVNGRRMQSGNTRTMIFPVSHLVHYVSQFMTIEPGDIITTGTPPGVGMGMKPPVYLKPGDVMRLRIAGLGEQTQRVVEWRDE